MVQIRGSQDTDRSRARRRSIVRAAGEAFRQHGFHGTSMRDIAASLGMAVGNLYYYFDNKQALLAFCQLETSARLLHLARSAAVGALSAADRLRWLIVGHVVCVNEAVPGATAHLTLDPLPEPARTRCVRRRDRYEAELRAVVREGIEHGQFLPVDPRVAVWTILGALNSTVTWYQRGGARSCLELGQAMADQLVRGLLAPGVALGASPDVGDLLAEFADELDESLETT